MNTHRYQQRQGLTLAEKEHKETQTCRNERKQKWANSEMNDAGKKAGVTSRGMMGTGSYSRNNYEERNATMTACHNTPRSWATCTILTSSPDEDKESKRCDYHNWLVWLLHRETRLNTHLSLEPRWTKTFSITRLDCFKWLNCFENDHLTRWPIICRAFGISLFLTAFLMVESKSILLPLVVTFASAIPGRREKSEIG